ncbi:VOC family protein [Nisaea sp.]|uniref:VOC family protein n=1 Tax=Nisaea sp. TaxID=2024842 RepID=UPI002B26BF1B|nr:VOC family protein [Nisaea sp.]
MTRKVAPTPKGYRTVTPQLVVRDAEAALSYYEELFGASVLSRLYAEDSQTVLQAELKIGNSIVRVMDEMPAFGILSPAGFGGTAVGMHLYLPNTDEVWERAVALGAGILVPLADAPWGERYGKFLDPFGHAWSVSRRIAPSAVIPETDDAEPSIASISGFSVHEPRADSVTPTIEQAMSRHAAVSGTASNAA